jgi:DNA-binding LacI/PurR family transcriptional regulator
MSITIKQIAEKLKVSPGTVSLALSGSPLVASKTRDLVQKTADKMGYTPSNLGRALRSGKSSLVGCFSSDTRDSFFWELFLGMNRKLAERDYGLLFSSPRNETSEEIDRCLNFMLKKNVDGVVFAGGFGTLQYRRIIPELEKRKIPFVFCSQNMKEENLPCIVTDDFTGGKTAAACLAQHGHSSILCQDTRSVPLRLKGNLAAAAEYDLRYALFHDASEVVPLLRSSGATAVTAYCDSEALKIIKCLKNANFDVPEDVSVIGYDNLFFAGRSEFELTTVGQAHSLLGEGAIEMLFCFFDNNTPVSSRELQPEIILRKTVKHR